MLEYPGLRELLARPLAVGAEQRYWSPLLARLLDIWLADYSSQWEIGDVVETSTSGFSYLFDIDRLRLLAAWGVSEGKHSSPRDKSHMRGFPLGLGPHYHRGHAIPHTLGGPCDINLVPQRGSVNVGAFRALEIKAVATPGSLYFTCWKYGRRADQTPIMVEQGLLVPGGSPRIARHPN